jgi:1-acyl-sn-glycerol-3-phosphate acyltransferase
MIKILQPFYTAFVLLSFLVCLIVIFPFFFLIGIRDKPLAREMIWYIVHYWSVGWLWLIGMPIKISGQKPVPGTKYIVVANHISYLDTVAIYASIPAYFRALAKKEMVRVPLFGFVYKQLAILVDRSSPKSRTKSMRLMWRILKNESNIAIFPEGTFNETTEPLKSFYDGAFRLAVLAQTPIVPLLFPDTINRWNYKNWWRLSPGVNRAVFLPAVEVKGLTAADIPALKDKIYKMMAEELLKYPYNKPNGQF